MPWATIALSSPCKEKGVLCAKRCPGCHEGCDKWATYQENLKQFKSHEKANQIPYNTGTVKSYNVGHMQRATMSKNYKAV